MPDISVDIGERLRELREELHTIDVDFVPAIKRLLEERLPAFDLVVHLERWRAINDATDDSELFDENCLLALDYLYRTFKFVALVR